MEGDEDCGEKCRMTEGGQEEAVRKPAKSVKFFGRIHVWKSKKSKKKETIRSKYRAQEGEVRSRKKPVVLIPKQQGKKGKKDHPCMTERNSNEKDRSGQTHAWRPPLNAFYKERSNKKTPPHADRVNQGSAGEECECNAEEKKAV